MSRLHHMSPLSRQKSCWCSSFPMGCCGGTAAIFSRSISPGHLTKDDVMEVAKRSAFILSNFLKFFPSFGPRGLDERLSTTLSRVL